MKAAVSLRRYLLRLLVALTAIATGALMYALIGFLGSTSSASFNNAGALLTLAALVAVVTLGYRLARHLRRLLNFESDLLAATGGILWEADPDTCRFNFVGDGAFELLGHPHEAWLKPGFMHAHLHPADRTWIPEYCELQNANTMPYQFEFRMRHASGEYIWVHNVVTVAVKRGSPVLLRGLMFDVTDRKRNELSARRLLAEKDAILQNALVGIAFVRERRVVTCNRRCEELFGYQPGELNGVSTERFFATPELFVSIGEEAYATATRGETYHAEVLLKYKNGTPFWGAVTGRVLDPGEPQSASVWIYADISQRRTAMEESRRLRRAVEQSPVSILITDRDGTIEYVNPKFTESSGFSREDALGQNPRIQRSGEMGDETYRDLWNTILAGKVWRGELRNRRKNDDLFWEDVTIAPVLDDRGDITHFIAIKADVTERKRYQDELTRYQIHLEELVVERTQALAKALNDARAADRAKDAFLSNVSHEMRTPLNAVIGLSSLALDGASDPRQRDYLEKISGAGATLLGIINDLLDLTKIAAGRMELDPQPFAPAPMIERLIAIMTHRAEEKGLELRLDVAADLPSQLLGDPLRINQILLNLLGNAIKFTDRGHVALKVGSENHADDAVLSFEVSDTGIGIEAGAQRSLFNPFTQADASITRRYGGTGLGLAICKQLVGMMGGELHLASEAGVGSTFRFALRLPLIGPGTETSGTTDISMPTPPRFQGARILLVEDQALNRQIARELLVKLGIAVDEAENGHEAVNRIEASDDGYFDLVLMDIQMPEMDGLTATRRLRGQPRFAQLPIVALTAHTLNHERAETLACGMNDHLGKPFDPTHLHRLLWRWLPTAKRAPRSDSPALEKRPAQESGFPSIDGFDFDGALRRCGGDAESYRRWLRTFLNEDRSVVEDVEHAINAGALELARKRVHALKGRSGMLGLSQLHEAAVTLESELKCAAIGSAPRQAFASAFLATTTTLTRLLEAPPQNCSATQELVK